MNTKKQELLDDLDTIAGDLKDATDSLISAVDDYIDEANDDDTSINRIKEIISAVESAVNNQETDLVF